MLIATKGNVCCVAGVSAIKYVFQVGSVQACVRACGRAYTSADTCSQPLICTCCLVVSRQVSHQPGELLLEEPSANCLNSCLYLCSRFSVCWGACLRDSLPVSFPSCLVGPTSACSCSEMKRWLRFRLFLYPPFFPPPWVSVKHIHSNKVVVFC